MDHVIYFKDLFESIPDYRKIEILMFLSEKDAELLNDCGFLKNDINRLKEDFKMFHSNKMNII